MLLAIDIGNTNVVCAVFKQNKVIDSDRMESDMNFFNSLIKFNKHNITQIIISSVVPKLDTPYLESCKNIFHIEPNFVRHDNCCIELDVEDPSEVGADRICNVTSLKHHYSVPGIIVDFGSATTYDIIDEQSAFIGGAIAPGIDVSARYLFEKAALLRDTAFTFPDSVIGKNTETNLQSGIMFSAIDEVDGMINRIKNETKWDSPTVVLTGGFSSLLSPKLKTKHILAPNLTLDGLRIINETLHS